MEDQDFGEYKAEFAGRVARLAAHELCATPPSAIVDFLLLHNAKINTSQRISVYAAATPYTDGFNTASSTNDYVAAIQYEKMASVLRQCYKTGPSVD